MTLPPSSTKLNNMGSAPIVQPSDSQPIPAIKIRKSRKAPALKTAVTLKRLQGQDKTSISRDLGIARNTVTAILEENDVERIMQDGQIETLRRVPAALRTLDARLEKNSENAALWLLDKCFESSKVQGKQNPQLFVAIQNLMQPTTCSVPTDNSTSITVESSQVVENKE